MGYPICSYLFDILELASFLSFRILKKPIANKTTLINSIAVITIKWTFPVTHCAQL